VGDVEDGDGVGDVVDAVDNPVGPAAGAVPVVERRAQLLADAVGLSSSGPTMNSWAAAATASGRWSVSWRRAVGVMARR